MPKDLTLRRIIFSQLIKSIREPLEIFESIFRHRLTRIALNTFYKKLRKCSF